MHPHYGERRQSIREENKNRRLATTRQAAARIGDLLARGQRNLLSSVFTLEAEKQCWFMCLLLRIKGKKKTHSNPNKNPLAVLSMYASMMSKWCQKALRASCHRYHRVQCLTSRWSCFTSLSRLPASSIIERAAGRVNTIRKRAHYAPLKLHTHILHACTGSDTLLVHSLLSPTDDPRYFALCWQAADRNKQGRSSRGVVHSHWLGCTVKYTKMHRIV